ncbi:pseudouridine synthase [Rhodohalobacter mucosus]|uniref:Pseudouridine synthase n=1 Tax=Rhodohalobacter mucosus TaxID=2079485 RepID=A0A316TUX0_9BACT|nr:pseudouridine synthase [Rhodohalobacter mucosus]PWN06885.1 rRNA pseudouridine synthase [Rhodohalobacter mucosus]
MQKKKRRPTPDSRKRNTRGNRSGGNEEKPNRRKRPSKSYGRKAKKADSSPQKSNRADQKPYLKDEIRINKYIAHAGLCSRRDADLLIEEGKVFLNDRQVKEPGIKVKPSDKVVADGQRLTLEPFVYILLNKGKDTISTTSDEKDRNTVLDAVEDATGYRVYPVGRLDRNTMGLLILTNDGDLAHRLMHPSYRVKKTYEVTSDRLLSDEELEKMQSGIELDDGPVKPAKVKRDLLRPDTIEISVFEGRNHLIRRIIGYFGADVVKLKRTRYAGLTDADLKVGRWRYLRQKEINDLRKLVKLDTLDFNKQEA